MPQLAGPGNSAQGRINALASMIMLYAILAFGPWGSNLNIMGYDLAASGAVSPAHSIRPVLVEIDDESLGYFGQWPWPRSLFAALIDSVRDAGANNIALDILINEPTNDTDDDALTGTVLRTGQVVMPVAEHPTLNNQVIGVFSALRGHVRFAHSEAKIDDDGIVRHVETTKELGAETWPALAFSLTRTKPPASDLLLPYPEPAPFERISAIDVLVGNHDPDVFLGMPVVIGVTAAGVAGSFMTPSTGRVTGVELQAYQIAAAANQNWWQIAPWPARIALWLPVFAGFAWLLRDTMMALVAVPLLAVLAFTISRYALQVEGLWLSPSPAIFAVTGVAVLWLGLDWRRNQALAALERARASATLAAVADAVIATDGEDRIVVVNDAAEKLLGQDRGSLLGRLSSDIPLLGSRARNRKEPAALRTPGGHLRDVLISTGQIAGSEGGTAFVLHDISDRERAQRALAESERERLNAERRLQTARRMSAMAEVSAAIAHELNQPLAALTTYAATAKRTIADDETQSNRQLAILIEKISAQANRSAGVVKQLRRVFEQARHPDGRRDLAVTLREALILAESELSIRPSQIELSVQDNLPPVAHDPIQMQQLILNLLRNSQDAHTDPAMLGIRISLATNERERVILTLEDNGPGIPPDKREAIFEPLHSSKPDGLGIGLAVCRSIAEAHGGTLSAKSIPSSGAHFVLSLPQKA